MKNVETFSTKILSIHEGIPCPRSNKNLLLDVAMLMVQGGPYV